MKGSTAEARQPDGVQLAVVRQPRPSSEWVVRIQALSELRALTEVQARPAS